MTLRGTQSWRRPFDVVAFGVKSCAVPSIFSEDKQTSRELRRLWEDFMALSIGRDADKVSINSQKKWNELRAAKPSVVWLVGPAEEEHVFKATYGTGAPVLRELEASALSFRRSQH